MGGPPGIFRAYQIGPTGLNDSFMATATKAAALLYCLFWAAAALLATHSTGTQSDQHELSTPHFKRGFAPTRASAFLLLKHERYQ
jgi:hypothetical protein